jgi:V/A-type H+-transporting ATPase subunit K|tara:strand:+ start:107 stop:424 length:318 start_codon:yes stop_codon:yes gene_type:complete
MNKMNWARKGVLLLLALTVIAIVADTAAAQEGDDSGGTSAEAMAKLGAGIALAGGCIGTGLGQGPIGAAAVGWIAEDGSKFGLALLFTVLPETILIFGFLAMFLL